MNIILQHFDGDLRDLDKYSLENIKAYAKLVGAEHRLVTGKPFRPDDGFTIAAQKIFMLDESFDEYEDVLMVDIDMFTPKGMLDNVFDLPGIGLYGPIQQRLHRSIVRNRSCLSSKDIPYWGGAIYKLSRDMRKLLRAGLEGDARWMNPYKTLWNFEDEGIMHSLAVKANFKPEVPYLGIRWCQCSYLPNPETAGFIHIRTKIKPEGPKRTKMENFDDLVKRGIIEQ